MTKDKSTGRSRDALTTGVQDRIVLMIQGWKIDWGEFNASALERKVSSCLQITCTRQGLMKKEAIKQAFDARMNLVGKAPPRTKPADEIVLRQRIDRVEGDLAKAKTKIEQLEELVARQRFNAKMVGIPTGRLEQPIAPLAGQDGKTA